MDDHKDGSKEPETSSSQQLIKRHVRFWNRSRVLLAGAITMAGTVASVIGVIPILTRDPSNFKHLEMSAEEIISNTSEWAVPPTFFEDEDKLQDLEEAFEGGKDPCGTLQTGWLQDNTQQMQRNFTLNVRNSASEGPMLALTDFRSTASGAEERGPINVRLVCDPTGVLPHSLTFATVYADNPEQQSIITKIKASNQEHAPEIPLAWNLAPGESGTIPVSLSSRYPANGDLQTTVLSGDENRDIMIEGSSFSVPALLAGGDMYLFSSEDGLVCQRIDRGTLETCSLEDIQIGLETAQH